MSSAEEQQRNREIEKYLRNEKAEYEKYLLEPKVLILGSSDSGKSTLLKQLKLVHGAGFNEEERKLSKIGIVKNILDAIANIYSECQNSEIIEVFLN